jgi:tetratricopeptide (TPR) repeat protein
MKYNPAFLSDQELIDTFVVRQTDLRLIMETVSENMHQSNQHLLVIGPRGSGKTTLARRVASEVRKRPESDARWYPLVFGEESYEVATAGQFWLEAVTRLGIQTKDKRWFDVAKELSLESDEQRLGQRALGQLMDFADEIGKRLLLIVENLNLILGEQISDDDAWSLRHTLMNEPRLMLLATATSRFDAIDNANAAMYELFRILPLEPLSETECQAVWKRVTGKDIPAGQARAIRILTGGSPRLLTVLAIFGADKSFRCLMEELTHLVDDHTDYFKSNIEGLAAAERKVFVCLAGLWREASASEVARVARITPSQASAMLARLVGRGAVTALSRGKRKKTYQLAERLYNIYYLMRKGQDSERVRAVVEFMVQFYGEERLSEAAADIAKEACGLEGAQRSAHFLAITQLLEIADSSDVQCKILETIPEELFFLSDIPETLSTLHNTWQASKEYRHLSSRLSLLKKITANVDKCLFDNAESCVRELLTLNPMDSWSWSYLGWLLYKCQNKLDDGNICLLKALEINPKNAIALRSLAELNYTYFKNEDKGKEYIKAYLDTEPDKEHAQIEIGIILYNTPGKMLECTQHFVETIKLFPESSDALYWLGVINENIHDNVTAEACFRKSISTNKKNTLSLTALGLLLCRKRSTVDQGKLYIKRAIKNSKHLFQTNMIHRGLAESLILQRNYSEAWHEICFLLNYPDFISQDLHKTTEVLTAAVAGLGQKILDLVISSPSAHVLEPLIVGIKLYLGQEITAPLEIREVAQDVVKRIEYWKSWLTKQQSADTEANDETSKATKGKDEPRTNA